MPISFCHLYVHKKANKIEANVIVSLIFIMLSAFIGYVCARSSRNAFHMIWCANTICIMLQHKSTAIALTIRF